MTGSGTAPTRPHCPSGLRERMVPRCCAFDSLGMKGSLMDPKLSKGQSLGDISKDME